MTISLARFDRVHLAAMTDLWVEAWTAAYPAIAFDRRRAWFAGRIEAFAAADVAVVLAFAEGDPAGFVTVDPRTGWIDQMLVGRAFQGSDVGRALMADARRLAPAGLSLDVNADNTRAIRFYAREGFVKTGARTNEQGAAIDLMAWSPPPRS